MKHNILKILAAAGSFAVFFCSQMVIKPYASPGEGYDEFAVNGPEECRRLLTEMVSQALPGERKEYFLTGEDYEPESLVIAQLFSDTINISNTKIKDYQKNGHRYVTCRIGFERVDGQKETETTKKEESVVGYHWQIGDIRSLKLGNEIYRFQCVDDDYGDNSDDQGVALFLCDTVIRSDVDSTDSKREILTFGRTNDYKTSDVRAWLRKNFEDTENEIPCVSTGVNAAYLGASVPGDFSEFTDTGFWRYELPVQISMDEIFLLSLEEAFEYRNFLWEISGDASAYSRGYWLRTPAYSENDTGDFCNGIWSYAIDLELGCIRPMEVSDGSIGLRPAFCLPQG